MDVGYLSHNPQLNGVLDFWRPEMIEKAGDARECVIDELTQT
jgi:hypothetical protein